MESIVTDLLDEIASLDTEITDLQAEKDAVVARYDAITQQRTQAVLAVVALRGTVPSPDTPEFGAVLDEARLRKADPVAVGITE
jgi:hypothetical protein